MQHRSTLLSFLSVAFIVHNVNAKLLGRDVGPSQSPERKPNLSCVLFYGDGLCIFKCRLFGQGAEGYCDNKTCMCKHKDTVYIEGENGFEPELTSSVGKRSSAGPESGSSSRYSDAPTSEGDEFTQEENQLKLKLITLMEFLSRSGQDICEFMRDNHVDIDAIRRLSEKERRLNGRQQSRSINSRSIPSESDILEQGKNIGSMVYNMIPDGCKIKLSRAQSGNPETSPRRHNALDNDDDDDDDDESSGNLNSKSLPNQFDKYDNPGKITPKALPTHHHNPNKKQYTLHADPTHTRSLHVVSPQHAKSKGGDSPRKVKRVPEKAGRYSFTYPLKKHNINHTHPPKPKMNISHFTPLPSYTVQPAMAQILPAVPKVSSAKGSPIHRVVASPKSNLRLRVKPTAGSKPKSAAKKVSPVPTRRKPKKPDMPSATAGPPQTALNKLKDGRDKDSAIDKMHTMLGLNNPSISKDPNILETPLKVDEVESEGRRKSDGETEPQVPLLHLPTTPSDKTVDQNRAEATSDEMKIPELVTSDNKELTSNVDQTPNESDPNKNEESLTKDRKNLLYVENPDAAEQSDSVKSEPQPPVSDDKVSRKNPSEPSAEEPTMPEIPTNVTDDEKNIDQTTPKESENLGKPLTQNSEMSPAIERGDQLDPDSMAGIRKKNDETSETAEPFDETNHSSQNDEELKEPEKLNSKAPQTDEGDAQSVEDSDAIVEPVAEPKPPKAIEAAPKIETPIKTEGRTNIENENTGETDSKPRPQTQPDEMVKAEKDLKTTVPTEMSLGQGSKTQLEPQIETVSNDGKSHDQTTPKDKTKDELEKVANPIAENNETALTSEREDAFAASPSLETNTVLEGLTEESKAEALPSAVAEANNSSQNDWELKQQDKLNEETAQPFEENRAESGVDSNIKSKSTVPLKSENEIETASEVQAPTEPKPESNSQDGNEGEANLKSESVPKSDGRLEVEKVPDTQPPFKQDDELKGSNPPSSLEPDQPNDLKVSENLQPLDTTDNVNIKHLENVTEPSGQEHGNKATAPDTELLNTPTASEENREEPLGVAKGGLAEQVVPNTVNNQEVSSKIEKGIEPNVIVGEKPEDEPREAKPEVNTDAGIQTSSNEGNINTDVPSSDAKDHVTEPKDLASSANEHTPVLGEAKAERLDPGTVPTAVIEPNAKLDNVGESLQNVKPETHSPQLFEPSGHSGSGKESETPEKPGSLNSEPQYQSSIGEPKNETKKSDDKEPINEREQMLGESKHSDDLASEAAPNPPEESNESGTKPDSEEKSKESPIKGEEATPQPSESSDNAAAKIEPQMETLKDNVSLILETTGEAKKGPESDETRLTSDTKDEVKPIEPEVEQEEVLEEFEDDDKNHPETAPKSLAEPEKEAKSSNNPDKKLEATQSSEPKGSSLKPVNENKSPSQPETKLEVLQNPEPEPKGSSSKLDNEEQSSNDAEKNLDVPQSSEPNELSSKSVDENNASEYPEKKSEVPQNLEPESGHLGLKKGNEEISSNDPEEKLEEPQSPEPESKDSSSIPVNANNSSSDPPAKLEMLQNSEPELNSKPEADSPRLAEPSGHFSSGKESQTPEKPGSLNSEPEYQSMVGEPKGETKKIDDKEPIDEREQVLGESKHSDIFAPDATPNPPEESNGSGTKPDSEEKSQERSIKLEEATPQPSESSDNADATKEPQMETLKDDVPLLLSTAEEAKKEPKSDETRLKPDTKDEVNPTEPEVEHEEVLEEYEDDDRNNLETAPKSLGELDKEAKSLNDLEKKLDVSQSSEPEGSSSKPVNENKSPSQPETKLEELQNPEPKPKGSGSKLDNEEKSTNDPEKNLEVPESSEPKELSSKPVDESTASDYPEKKLEVPRNSEPEPEDLGLKQGNEEKSSNDPEKKLEVPQSPEPVPKSSSSKPDDKEKSSDDPEKKWQMPQNLEREREGPSSQPIDERNATDDPMKKSEVPQNFEPSNIPKVEHEPQLNEPLVSTNSIPLNNQLEIGSESGKTPRLDKEMEPEVAEKEDSSKPQDEQEQVVEEYEDDDEQLGPATALKSLGFSSPPPYAGPSSNQYALNNSEKSPEDLHAHEPSNNRDQEPPNKQQGVSEVHLNPAGSAIKEDSIPKETPLPGKDTTSEVGKERKDDTQQAFDPNVANTPKEGPTKEEILAEYEEEAPIDDYNEHQIPEEAVSQNDQIKPYESTDDSIAPILPVSNNRENLDSPENLNANPEKSSEESPNRNPANTPMESELGKHPSENKMDEMQQAFPKPNEPTTEVSDHEEVLAEYDEENESPHLDLENENDHRGDVPSLNVAPEVSSGPRPEDTTTLNLQDNRVKSVPTVETTQPNEKSVDSDKNSDDKSKETKQPQSEEETVLDEYTDHEIPFGAEDIEPDEAKPGIKIMKDCIMDKTPQDDKE